MSAPYTVENIQPEGFPPRWLVLDADGGVLCHAEGEHEANLIAGALNNTTDTAGIVLDGEPCPEACVNGCDDSTFHENETDQAFDLLWLIVDRARKVLGTEPDTTTPQEPTAYPEHLTGDRW